MSLLWLTAFGFRAVAASASVSTEARTSPLRSCAEVQGQPEPPLLFDVPHDGNCLFSAVALSVAIVDDAPAQTRARAVRTAAARLRSSAMDLLCPHGSPDPELSFGGSSRPGTAASQRTEDGAEEEEAKGEPVALPGEDAEKGRLWLKVRTRQPTATFTLRGLLPGTKYCFVVRAHNE